MQTVTNQNFMTPTRFERITFRSGVECATVAPRGLLKDPRLGCGTGLLEVTLTTTYLFKEKKPSTPLLHSHRMYAPL
ncbi:hypothetical protein F4819DRAFT_478915 [Hypoxylon fuscum]|nr:hypothetical protein F4819DRAFT_478915 [Hypoxylon fuscum]